MDKIGREKRRKKRSQKLSKVAPLTEIDKALEIYAVAAGRSLLKIPEKKRTFRLDTVLYDHDWKIYRF